MFSCSFNGMPAVMVARREFFQPNWPMVFGKATAMENAMEVLCVCVCVCVCACMCVCACVRGVCVCVCASCVCVCARACVRVCFVIAGYLVTRTVFLSNFLQEPLDSFIGCLGDFSISGVPYR